MIGEPFVPALYVNAGAELTLEIDERDSGRPCQWRLNGEILHGRTGASLALANVGTMDGGTYSVATDGSAAGECVDVACVTVVSRAALSHCAVSGFAGGEDRTLIAGLVLDGIGPKRLRLASERGLMLYGPNGLPDPLERGAAERTVPTGSYTVLVATANAPVVAEVADADETPSSWIMNLSARGWVDGETTTLVAEFTITGSTSATLLVRGLGPQLAGVFGPDSALRTTRLTLRDADGATLASVAGGEGLARLGPVFARVGACALPPASADSALLVTLPAGTYTAELSGERGATGVALLELYQVPSQ